MKNIFVLLVFVAAGYLLVTQTSVSQRVMSLMPNAQFEQLHHQLTQQIDHSLTQKLPKYVDEVKLELQQLVDERWATNEPVADINLQQAELDSLLKQVAKLTEQVNQLTHANAVQAEKINAASESNRLPVSDVSPTSVEQDYIQVNTGKHNQQEITELDDNKLSQQKLMLQKITTQMNQQTLSLLAQ